MAQLKMKGRQITDAATFQRYFDPGALLRRREEAAGFLYQQTRFLSPEARYHTEMFFQTVYEWEFCLGFPPQEPMDYFLAEGPSRKLNSLERQCLLRSCRDPQVSGLLETIWQIAMGAELPEEDRLKLYCLLASGCLLADANTCTLTPRQASLAYRKQQEPVSDRFPAPSPDGIIRLAARKEPYRLTIESDVAFIGGMQLQLRKILAVPHLQGAQNIPVTLILQRSSEDPQPVTEVFYPGDYRYCNFLGDQAVYFHPVAAAGPEFSMERTGSRLVITRSGCKPEFYPIPEADLVGIIPEQTGDGWILLQKDQPNYLSYSKYDTFAHRLPQEDIVQVGFQGIRCLLLDKYGKVYSNLGMPDPGPWATLEQYIKSQKKEGES